ncbi:hypothetical protein BA6E_124364 [Bacteroidales bacterium 6E]|nr:hypothetical protein BA6E_124364 [Bacteroidales bacterium 6E]
MEEAKRLSDNQLLEFLKESWETDSLILSGEYTGDRFVNIMSGTKQIKYPINQWEIFFKFIDPRFRVGRRYAFECELADRAFREKVNNLFILNIIKSTIHQVNAKKAITKVTEIEISKIKDRLRLDNDFFIGQFSPLKTPNTYRISDIRNTDFTKIEDKERGIVDLTIVFNCHDQVFNKYAYYKFTWTLSQTTPLKFGIDLSQAVVPLFPKDIVQFLANSIARYTAKAARQSTSSLETLNKQLTQSGKEVFIYELLQNANDYPKRSSDGDNYIPVPVDVEFHITSSFLTFQHTGEYFNPKNIAAICDINDGEKSDNVEAIGYKGIGFKTVFLDNDYVYLKTGNYSFRFDKFANDIINTPWQILPVWTDQNSLPPIIRNLFNHNSDDTFRVKFAFKPRDRKILTDRSRKDNYIDLFKKVFDTERVILFIPNIQKVSVFFENSAEPEIVRSKDNLSWCVSKALTEDVPEFVQRRITEVLTNREAYRSDGYDKVPEKYLNFNKTAIRFACRRDERKLLPVEKANLYCYLPAKKANWGFKFLMNTDMIPNGSRDDIEDIELNHEIAKIAGRQFYNWIKSLIKSGEYELNSIFSLIPDFDECKLHHQDYETFIQEFQDEFESLIYEEPFVPVVDENGNSLDACINEIVDDLTKITSNAVMLDSDFISIMGMSGNYLPIQELRESKSFMDFLNKYCPTELEVNFDDVKEKCTNDDFQAWLKNPENNSKFIDHLLITEKLDSFSSESIFIEYEGALFMANELYYEFDKHCSGISFLRNYIPHLSEKTKEYFKNNESWQNFAFKEFKDFDAQELNEQYILDDDDAVSLLEEISNSKCFYNFIADNSIDLSDHSGSIPFIDEDGNIIYGFEGQIYFYDNEAYTLSNATWLGENKITILSHEYFPNCISEGNLKKTFESLGVSVFIKSEFIADMIVGDSDFLNAVNDAIEKDFEKNLSFLKYVFEARELLKDKDLQLRKYVLKCNDIEGDESYLNSDDLRYFSQPSSAGNTSFEDNSNHVWLEHDMMYCLDPEYFGKFSQEDQRALEGFLRQSFGIKTFTNKSFFSEVVLANRKIIYKSLNTEEKLLAFLDYLKRDFKNIFDGSLSFNDIQDIPLLCYDGSIIEDRDSSVRLLEYDEAAIELRSKKWCPEGVFEVLSDAYSTGFDKSALQLLKIETYNFAAIIDSLAVNSDLINNLDDVTNNIDFWRWIKSNQKSIESYGNLMNLYLVDTNNSTDYSCPDLYISDIYQKDGIESIVRKYDSDAVFISEKYLEDDSETNKLVWSRLLKKLGLKSDNIDILFNSILPNLSEFEDDGVVAMLTNHIKELKEKWDECKEQLRDLKVKTKSGDYLTLDSIVIIDINDDTVSEPFKYIDISNEVEPGIYKTHKGIILLIAKEFEDNNILTTKQAWAQRKIEEYVENIQDDAIRRNGLHIEFVRELAHLDESYKFPSELYSTLKFKTKNSDNELLFDVDITLGAAYNPKCDFESNGIDSLAYLSEDYITENNKDTIISFFKARRIHQSFDKEDINLLINREFSVYFWSSCFLRKTAEYKKWIEEGLFDETNCIPTETSLKKPGQLYSPDIYNFARKSPNWQEKLPAKEIVDRINHQDAREVFYALPFMASLEFADCLYYLLNANDRREVERDNRAQVLEWILASENIEEKSVKVYRENPNALWRNGKGQKKHINELYILHPEANQERYLFSGDEHVMQNGMFPYKTVEFERICDILKIKYLRSTDFTAKPVNSKDETPVMLGKILPKLLVIAAIENPDSYQKLHEQYTMIIKDYKFFVCDKIDLGYDSIHNDVERIYSDESNIYYVTSWLHNRTYTKFCGKLKRLLKIEVSDNVFEDVLDDSVSVESSIDKYCSSRIYDKDFQELLKGLNQSITIIDEEPEPDEAVYYEDPISESIEVDDIEDIVEEEEGPDIEIDSDVEPISQYNDEEVENDSDESYAEPVSTQHQQTAGTHSSSTDSKPVPRNRENQHVEPDTERQSPKYPDRPYPSRNRQYKPKPFTKEEIEKFKSKGATRVLGVSEVESFELDQLNNLLGENMTAEEIADTNYLVQYRLYQNLIQRGDDPEESLEDFIKSNSNEHNLRSGKYIHKCSATYGILYISPSIWNKVADDKCIICVYLGKRANDFMYLRSIRDILDWVHDDDILIKLTGEEKVDVVNELYSGVLEGVKGTAYTLIRVGSNAAYNSVFGQLLDDPNQVDKSDEF